MSNQRKEVATYSAIVGSIIANYRKSRNLGQAEISAKLNISQATWSRIERGNTAINVSQLSEIAALFGVSPHELLLKADQMADELKMRGIRVSHYPDSNNEAMFLLGTAALIGLAALLFGNE